MRIIAIWALVNATIGLWAGLLGYIDRGAGMVVGFGIVGMIAALVADGVRRQR